MNFILSFGTWSLQMKWCLFPLLCLLPLGQGVQICWRLRCTISHCAWVLWSVAYNSGTVPFCCCQWVGHVWNISAVRFACEFTVWFGLCYFLPFLIHWIFVLALFAQSMVPLLLYWILIWLGLWGLVCQLWLCWWLGEVISPLELVSCWAPLELGADCCLTCWVSLGGLAILSKVIRSMLWWALVALSVGYCLIFCLFFAMPHTQQFPYCSFSVSGHLLSHSGLSLLCLLALR